jgi:hypothetical protein
MKSYPPGFGLSVARFHSASETIAGSPLNLAASKRNKPHIDKH